MAYDGKRQRTLLFGGEGEGVGPSPAGDTWEWDGTVWTQLAEKGPSPREAHSMAYDSGRDRTVLFGGIGPSAALGDTWATLGDTWEWNGTVWTQISSFGAQPSAFAALAFKGDSVALFGGASGIVSSGDPTTKFYGITWTWDGEHWTLRQDFGPPPLFGHAMCYDSKRACLVVFGGATSASSVSGDTWEHFEGP
jgi:hypothetical protein